MDWGEHSMESNHRMGYERQQLLELRYYLLENGGENVGYVWLQQKYS
jgi:hypothetical protein